MAFTLLGSFPNSQVRPRKATEVEITDKITAPLGLSTLIAANPDRTFLTIVNEGVNPFRWGTLADPPDANNGFLVPVGSGVSNIETQEEIQVFAIGGATDISIEEGSG